MALFKTDKINSSENQSNEKEKTNKKNTGKENVIGEPQKKKKGFLKK